MKRIFTALIWMLLSPVVFSQENNTDSLSKKELRNLRREEKIKRGALVVTPLGGPAYTPEMQFSLAAGILTSFRTSRSDTSLQRSSAPVTVGFSTTGAFYSSIKMNTFWLHDKIRGNLNFWFKHMPDQYFGVGYEHINQTVKSDSTTAYERTWVQFNPEIYWHWKNNMFIGTTFDLNYTKGSDASAGVANDEYYIQYNDRPRNLGLGLLFLVDSRDVAVNAWKGWYLALNAMFYGTYFGGQNNYQVYNLDLRHYITIHKPGHTLALQLRSRVATSDVPYAEMSQLGTPFDLRGYLWGEYRDKTMLFGIAEYRHTFYKRNNTLSKHGLVGWIATGSIDEKFSYQYWLPNAGIGYRFEVQPRMAVRLDFGIGRDSFGFYFNFNEAF